VYCWLNNTLDSITLIARIILSLQGSNSRLGYCNIIRSSRKRCSLGKSAHFACLHILLASYVNTIENSRALEGSKDSNRGKELKE
jgi:hypothetical protein